ncbi:MAG: molybdopterin-dependent oxidoreductase [Proteobacteria bacterium]|nr:molybdopterin-dependent oxidoreductase [Pseudomonadota bacterium]MCP4919756.1 molybdopterin-dependent oxidoreductase [Pseudomonadota bacterium]
MKLGERGGKIDGLPKITGSAVFTGDLSLPGMLHAAFHRSPHPHARIVSIDTSKALAVQGVHAVLTGADLPVNYGVIPVAQDEHALATEKVRFVGEEVACVAAVDRATAIAAARLVEVTYELLRPVLSIEDALDPEKPVLHDKRRKASNILRRVHQKYGDPDAGFERADVVIDAAYDYPGSTHVPLEPQTAVAIPDAQGRLELWSSTQIPHYLHRTVARVLELRPQDVRVRKPDVGAGYGGKSDPFANELCAAKLALVTGRPVRCVLDREEVFYAHRGRHRTKMTLSMGVTNDGEITAARFTADAEGGAYASYGVVTAYYFGVFLPLPYKLDHWQFTARRCYTNHPPCGPKRGHGAIQPRFALELHMNKLADAIGMDPAELRRRNSVEPDTETSNGLRITSVALNECLDAAMEASGYREKRGNLGPNRGIGIAASAYMCGALHSIYKNEMPQSAVQICADRSGLVRIFSGTADIGQGSNHMLAHLVSGELGIPAEDCPVLEADTHFTPVDLGSYSSRVTFFAGNAALNAARKLKEAITSSFDGDVRFEDGQVHVGQGDDLKSMPFRDAVIHAEGVHGTLGFVGHYTPPKIGSRFRRQSVGPSPAYSFTAQVAEVTVDPETGFVTIDRIWCAHDCGKAINPTIVEGQIEGSVYMGVGEALLEEHVFTGPKGHGGLHRNPSILEYKIPTIHDTPPIEAILIESNDPEGPHGAKEAGEGPQLATVPAIANAIHDACGIWLDAAPFTPDRVLRALERAERGRR